MERATSWENMADILEENLEERSISIKVERVEVWIREVNWRGRRGER